MTSVPRRWLAIGVLGALVIGSALAGAAIDRLLPHERQGAVGLPDTAFHPIESILRSPTAADRRAIRAELTRQLH